MAGFVIKGIVGLVVVGAIFFTGVLAGGSFATGMAEESVLQHVARCLPAETLDQLRPCLAQSGGSSR